jgi:hypothetical protein
MWGYRKGQVRRQLHGPAHTGLCGNFNGDTTDDFTTSGGIDEGTASLFVDSWRAGNCPAALERETDPCSMSQLNSESPLGPWPPRSAEWGVDRRLMTDPIAPRGVCRDPLLSAAEEG